MMDGDEVSTGLSADVCLMDGAGLQPERGAMGGTSA